MRSHPAPADSRTSDEASKPRPVPGLWVDRLVTVLVFGATLALICLSPLGQ